MNIDKLGPMETKTGAGTKLAEVDVDRIISSGEWNVVEYEASFARSVYMNLTNGIFDNVKVRQALAYATNKENMVALIQNGMGNVADSFFHPEMMVNTSAPDTILNCDLFLCIPGVTRQFRALMLNVIANEGLGIMKLANKLDCYPQVSDFLKRHLK